MKRVMLLCGSIIMVGLATSTCCQAAESGLRWLLTSHAGADIYHSEARTQGGIGGGIGSRLVLQNRWLVEASLGLLASAGSVEVVRVSAGIQWPSAYCPALLVGGRLMFGDAMHFLTVQHRVAQTGPSLSLGISLAPVRFRANHTELLFGSLYVGRGSDFPGSAWGYGVTLLEVGTEL